MTDEFASVPRLNPSQRSAMPESDASTSQVVRRTLPILVVLMSFVALVLSADHVIRSGYFTIQRVEVTTRLDVVDRRRSSVQSGAAFLEIILTLTLERLRQNWRRSPAFISRWCDGFGLTH